MDGERKRGRDRERERVRDWVRERERVREIGRESEIGRPTKRRIVRKHNKLCCIRIVNLVIVIMVVSPTQEGVTTPIK